MRREDLSFLFYNSDSSLSFSSLHSFLYFFLYASSSLSMGKVITASLSPRYFFFLYILFVPDVSSTFQGIVYYIHPEISPFVAQTMMPGHFTGCRNEAVWMFLLLSCIIDDRCSLIPLLQTHAIHFLL